MATIDSKEFIDKIIAGNGRIDQDNTPDNPRALRITEYTNAYGGTAFGVIFPGDKLDKYQLETYYVRNPKIIWELGK